MPMPTEPDFEEIEFDISDLPYKADGTGYVQKLTALKDNMVACVQWVIDVVAYIATDLITTAAGHVAAALGHSNTASTHATNASLSAAAAAASATQCANLVGALSGTSATSLLIGTGAKVFATQSGEQYVAGVYMMAASQANPANFMFGQVTSYVGTTLTLNVTVIGGSGTFADWNLSLAGVQGAPGAGITPQPVGWTGSGGTSSRTLTVDANATISSILASIAAAGISATSTVTSSTTTTTTQTHYKMQPADYGMNMSLIAGSNFSGVGVKYIFENDSAFDVAVRNASNTLLGFVAPGESVTAVLTSTAGDGTWSLCDAQDFGVTCSVAAGSVLGATVQAIELDSRYVLFLSNGGNAVVVDRLTNTVGAAVAVTTRISDMRMIKHSSTAVLLVSGTTGAANIYARLLTISGTTITANTEASVAMYSSANFDKFKSSGAISTTTGKYGTEDGSLISVAALQANTYFVQAKCDNGVNKFYSHHAIQVSGTTVTIGAAANSAGAHHTANDGAACVLGSHIMAICPNAGSGAHTAYAYTVSGTTLTQVGTAGGGDAQNVIGLKVCGVFVAWFNGGTTAYGVKMVGSTPTYGSVGLSGSMMDVIHVNGALRELTTNGVVTLYDNAGTLATNQMNFPMSCTGAHFLTEPVNNKCFVASHANSSSGFQAVYKINFSTTNATIEAIQSQPHDNTTTNPIHSFYALSQSRATQYGFDPQRGALRGTRSARDLRSYRHWLDIYFEFDKGRLIRRRDKSPHPGVMVGVSTAGGTSTIAGIGQGPSHKCTLADGGTIGGTARYNILEIV